ncbi:cell division protein FtsZ [Bacillus sp. AFS055030]|uniref:cell division protein FtsZ n=1 Tax=Bacillus sp. AFS055030 TaxID=2033507 RepID=UPI000BFC9964|nr:cell division protein FtsZ [Bacillus sp. AFS055030]PGL67979.1 cell division protein FtsZ [Bacillus sp. AFS055030]
MILSKQTEFTATYQFGKTKVNIIAPDDVTEENKKKIIEEIQTIGWKIVKEELFKKDDK